MTIDEAIKILENGSLMPYASYTAKMIDDACSIAVDALRAQQKPPTLQLSVNDLEVIEAALLKFKSMPVNVIHTDEAEQHLNALKSENAQLKHDYDSLFKCYKEKESECFDAWDKIIALQKQIEFLSGQIEAFKFCAKSGD